MRREIGFLIVGLATGFVLGSFWKRLQEQRAEESADDLASLIADRLDGLESEFSPA